MRWPVLLLAVPATGLGLAALAGGFVDRLGPGTAEVGHLGAAVVVPLLLALGGAALAALMWRRRDADPADLLPARRTLVAAFYLDAVQDALVTRPVLAVARWVKRGDEAVVDGAVHGTGVAAVRAGGLLAWAHRAGVPRAAGAALAGAVLLGLAAAVLEWTR
jgi:NADH-quinone oxidoreductase subunit L